MKQERRARDREWFEHLFREYHQPVRAYARRRVPSEADDIVSDVFATAWQRREVVPEQPLPWLYRTAANHVLHAKRSWAGQDRVQRALIEAHQPPVSTAAFGPLERALSQVPEADQEILRLWAWEQLEPQQIGEALGCGAANTRVRLFRARRRLRAQLGPAFRTSRESVSLLQESL